MAHTVPGYVPQHTYTPVTPTHAGAAVSEAAVCRQAGYLGFVATVAIIVGIAAVSMIPDQMNTTAINEALSQIRAHPTAEILAGWMFAIGLTALAPFTWLLVRTIDMSARLPATIGASVLSIGIAADVVCGMAMVTLGQHSSFTVIDPTTRAAGTALVAMINALDAFYNLALGSALILLGLSVRRSSTLPRWLGTSAIAVGALSLPVALEWHSRGAAAFQYVSGTLFLVWLVTASGLLVRKG
jgi:hypothetical protein